MSSSRVTARSSFGHQYCCLIRVPHALWSVLKWMPSDGETDGYILTGIDTRPKAIVPDEMARAAMNRSILVFAAAGGKKRRRAGDVPRQGPRRADDGAVR